MPRARPAVIAAAGNADDLEAAYYDALQGADLERLMACWADDEEIVCVHPGGQRVIGLAAIRATFESIFAHGAIRAHPEQLRKVETLSSAVHNLVERVEVMTDAGPAHAYVMATNVYHKGPEGWRMVAHHASPATDGAVQEIRAVPSVLH